jgi:hypothetical protein
MKLRSIITSSLLILTVAVAPAYDAASKADMDGDHPLGQGQQHEENDGEGEPTAEIQGV